MLTLFDEQVALRMGQANVRTWVDDILPLLKGDAYSMFQGKHDGAVKVLFRP
jgi:hypothetical protein